MKWVFWGDDHNMCVDRSTCMHVQSRPGITQRSWSTKYNVAQGPISWCSAPYVTNSVLF